MFQFPGFAPRTARCRNRFRRVAPFGNLRLNGYLPLAAAYRSLSRPSSPPRAKASFMCPSLLSLFFSWKVAFDNLSIFAVSANIPSACEVLICLVDVLFLFLIDLLVIIALHKWLMFACLTARLKVTCEVLQFPTCQCSLFFV